MTLKMNSFINSILREAEDSSDDFFQSKHVNKRKENFEKEKRERYKRFNKEHKDIFDKLSNGLKRIKRAYESD